jgi:hypothetical protein
MNQAELELEEIFADPDYDQSRLQQWFQHQYKEHWRVMWNRYIETGRLFL